MDLPRVIATSVVRSSQQGESHGGVYLVDLATGEFEQVIDWNDPLINWEGRGADRGLRGIGVSGEKVYLAASDEIFVFDPNFLLTDSFRNPYLKHCHEVYLKDKTLYLTSTGLNSILEFDIQRSSFRKGYQITRKEGIARALGKLLARDEYDVRVFDASSSGGPQFNESGSNLHLNNVSYHNSAIMVSGTKIDALLEIRDDAISPCAVLPRGTHNAAIHGDGVVFNDTANSRIVVADLQAQPILAFEVPPFDAAELTHTNIPLDHARQGFARGLIAHGDLLIGGSSPSTISVYSRSERRLVCSINLSKDIRNCIHGLELWPH
ncbi:MAG: hypothetical protein ABI839_00050 [Verrucomicrobiota bacterium]